MKILNLVGASFEYKDVIDKYFPNEEEQEPELVIYSLDADVTPYISAKKVAVYSFEDEIDFEKVDKNWDVLLTNVITDGLKNQKLVDWALMSLVLTKPKLPSPDEYVSSIINVYSSRSTPTVEALKEDADLQMHCEKYGYELVEGTSRGIGEVSIVTDLGSYKEVMPYQVYKGLRYGQTLVIPQNLMEFICSGENNTYPPVYSWAIYLYNFYRENGDNVFKYLRKNMILSNRALLKFGLDKIGCTSKALEKKLKDVILH